MLLLFALQQALTRIAIEVDFGSHEDISHIFMHCFLSFLAFLIQRFPECFSNFFALLL